jgi:hypothetical protein
MAKKFNDIIQRWSVPAFVTAECNDTSAIDPVQTNSVTVSGSNTVIFVGILTDDVSTISSVTTGN